MLESKGYGEVKLTYDASMAGDNMTVILKGTFEPYDAEFPVIDFFERKYTTDIIASEYPSKDIALYNWWHHFIYAYDTNKKPIDFEKSKGCSYPVHPAPQFPLPPLYTINYESPLHLLNQEINPKMETLKQKLIDMEAKIALKAKAQKEQQFKALVFVAVEKDLALIPLFSALLAPESQFNAPQLSDVLAQQGVEALLKTIADLGRQVSAFQPKGVAKELPFLLTQLRELNARARVVAPPASAAAAAASSSQVQALTDKISTLEAALAESQKGQAGMLAMMQQLLAAQQAK